MKSLSVENNRHSYRTTKGKQSDICCKAIESSLPQPVKYYDVYDMYVHNVLDIGHSVPSLEGSKQGHLQTGEYN